MKISASMRPHKPTPEERKALKGETNVEALLNALDQRMTEKAEVILVGRASYEIGDREFTKRIKERLNEEEKIDNRTGKIHLTDDIDCYYSESAEPIINIGQPISAKALVCSPVRGLFKIGARSCRVVAKFRNKLVERAVRCCVERCRTCIATPRFGRIPDGVKQGGWAGKPWFPPSKQRSESGRAQSSI